MERIVLRIARSAAIGAAISLSGTPVFAAPNAAESKYIHAVEEAVRYHLKDPESARFRNVRAKIRNAKIGDGVVCGEVNSKNSYGGYIGFKRFYGMKKNEFNDDYDASIEGEGPKLDREIFAEMWAQFCGPGPLPPAK